VVRRARGGVAETGLGAAARVRLFESAAETWRARAPVAHGCVAGGLSLSLSHRVCDGEWLGCQGSARRPRPDTWSDGSRSRAGFRILRSCAVRSVDEGKRGPRQA